MDFSRSPHNLSLMPMDLLSAERDILSAGGDIRVGEIDFLDVEEVLLWVGLQSDSAGSAI